MRLLAVGDIHGCLTALAALAAVVPFRPDDLLVTLGDYVDRGPDSRSVVDWLINWGRTGRLVALRGNHELMMLDSRRDLECREAWLTFGGQATLESYGSAGDGDDLAQVPETHWRFFEDDCRDWFETETHFFVHAGAYPVLALDEQPASALFWERFEYPSPHVSGKIMVCGHTPQSTGLPKNLGHAVCIDTWACGHGWLTCLEPATGRYWQANQREETRTAQLVADE